MENPSIQFEAAVSKEQVQRTANLAAVIWPDCYAHLLKKDQIDYMVARMQSAQAMQGQIEKEGYEYYIIVVNGKDAGYIGVQAKDEKLLLSKMYLLADYRGQGIGPKVLEFVEALGKKRDASAVWLTVNRKNDHAISVYRKVGFEQTGTVDTDIGGGFTMNDFIFEKPL